MRDLSTIVKGLINYMYLDGISWAWKREVSPKELAKEYGVSEQELNDLACAINTIFNKGWYDAEEYWAVGNYSPDY